jgi:response regulator RpfG family c-di-GMP phosphodiesterase
MSTTTPAKVQILCVDDEPDILEGLALHLRRAYDLLTATSGAAGLELLKANPGCAVIISDMRMPKMDGATFLTQSRLLAPDSVRILLTGQTDINAAIAAINEGRIFRFLTKPCSTVVLRGAVEAAIEQHRLITDQKVLLQRTLHGSIEALANVLALTNPVSFGRAARIRRQVTALAERIELAERWPVEVAATLSQLGYLTLPVETAERVQRGEPLSDHERTMVDGVPQVTEQLLAHIPRLEAVRSILALAGQPQRWADAGDDVVRQSATRSAQILRLAIEFDVLETGGEAAETAIEILRGRGTPYAPEMLEALAHLHRAAAVAAYELRELAVSALRVGMVIAADVYFANGLLLVARGYEVTAGFLARAGNYPARTIREPVRVVVPKDAKSA